MKEYTIKNLYADTLITAIEGGINYWADVTSYHIDSYGDPLSVTAQIKDIDTCVVYNIDQSIINKAIRIVNQSTDDDNLQCNDELIKLCAIAKRYPEDVAVNIDANYADQLVQIGLFGQVIYG